MRIQKKSICVDYFCFAFIYNYMVTFRSEITEVGSGTGPRSVMQEFSHTKAETSTHTYIYNCTNTIWIRIQSKYIYYDSVYKVQKEQQQKC